MQFEVFDPGDPGDAGEPVRATGKLPMVRVIHMGTLLMLNRRAFELVPWRPGDKVHLLFDRDERVAGMIPAHPTSSGTSVFQVAAYRSADWPAGVQAQDFVEHYNVAYEVFTARLELTTGMLTFPVGAPRVVPFGTRQTAGLPRYTA